MDKKEALENIGEDGYGFESLPDEFKKDKDVVLAARNCREIVPTCHICMGGHHPIAFPFEAAQLPEFDSIVVGEGEVAFTELVKSPIC